MVTENMKNLCATILESTSTMGGLTRMIGIDGRVGYAQPKLNKFPAARAETYALSATAAGVSFGTDGTPVTELDKNLGATITSGVNVSLTSRTLHRDSNGNPYIQYKFTVTNTGNSTLTIREVGYKQEVNCASSPLLTDENTIVCLLDRTVPETPLVIEPDDAGIVDYTLKTVSVPPKTKGGVTIASFTDATDAQFTAMITAARNGTIDLQDDCGWRVGDVRTISMGAWTDADGTSHAAADIDIVLSSFAEYEGCGNIVQFDFMNAMGTVKMNSTSTNVGGYGASDGKASCALMFAAMPQYLRDLMKEFSVKASAGSQSSEIVTITGNKLAMRSEVEIFGTTSYSKAGEGVQVDLYKMTTYRIKRNGRIGSSVSWWERSPSGSSSDGFCYVNNYGNAIYNSAASSYGVAPFGCI